MENICNKLRNFKKQDQEKYLKEKYSNILGQMLSEGGYIWGTGRLGEFAFKQCTQNRIKIYGYIDNDEKKWNVDKKIYSPDKLTKKDIVIIASIDCADIIRQLEGMGIKQYIYYEDMAYIWAGMETYYQAFKGLFDEIEKNREKYIWLYDILEDEISKKVYAEVMDYRMSLDLKHIVTAYQISGKEGDQYFDHIITPKLNKGYTFYDVGGFKGESTLDYIKYSKGYKKIFFLNRP